jgi:hypothetical protein
MQLWGGSTKIGKVGSLLTGGGKAFREASLKGWEYAMQHPEELVDLIYSRYSQRHSLEHLRFEAQQMEPLLQSKLVEIGHMNPGRWRHIAQTYTELGMMKPDFNFKGFLYDPNPTPPDLSWLFLFMGVAALVITVVSALAFYIYRINARLHQEAAESKRVEAEREKLIHELEKALARVNQLSGLLPICASCKKVREDSGYWTQIEAYVQDRSEAEFSHGICPECAEKLYPEFFGKDHVNKGD